MDKYLPDLIDAHWTVAEKAFSERSIEDLRQLLDRIEALSGSGSCEPVDHGQYTILSRMNGNPKQPNLFV